jgi:hypothetical protein
MMLLLRKLTVAVLLCCVAAPAFAPPFGARPPAHPEIYRPPDFKRSPDDLPGHYDSSRLNSERAFKSWIDELLRRQPERYSVPKWTLDWTVDPSKSNHFTIYDGFKPDVVSALKDYIATDAQLARLGIEKWRLKHAATFEEIHEVLQLAGKPLPGEVELGLFLDPVTFKGVREEITQTWNSTSLELPADTAGLDIFLSRMSGKTLLLVSHVEGSEFVMRGADKRIAGSISVPELIEKARLRNVLVVPLGCKTADAGAPFGFMKNINTDQVKAFLRSIQAQNSTVGDLFIALGRIGELYVNMSTTRSFLELAVVEPDAKEPVVRIQVPRRAVHSAAANTTPTAPRQQAFSSTAFESTILAAAEKFRPWWDRGIIRHALRYLSRLHWITVGIVAVLLLAAAGRWGVAGFSKGVNDLKFFFLSGSYKSAFCARG